MKREILRPWVALSAGAFVFLSAFALEVQSFPDQKRDAIMLALSEVWKLRNAEL
jgi:hypothetical protein